MSATIVPFLRDNSFDPETTRVMGRAYDTARSSFTTRANRS